jgi:hypothetical protein
MTRLIQAWLRPEVGKSFHIRHALRVNMGEQAGQARTTELHTSRWAAPILHTYKESFAAFERSLFSAEWRREVRQSHISRIHFIHQLSIRFGLFLHAFPLRIILERLPIGCSRFPAGMLKNVNESIALLRFIQRSPVRHAFHSVPLKNFDGVVTEARLQLLQFPWGSVIDPQLKYPCRTAAVRSCSRPEICGDDGRRRNRLQ